MRSRASLHTGDAAELITLEDAARLLLVEESTVRSWIDNGTMPYVRGRSGPRDQFWIPLQGMLNVLGSNKEITTGLVALDQRAEAAELSEAKLEEALGGS